MVEINTAREYKRTYASKHTITIFNVQYRVEKKN